MQPYQEARVCAQSGSYYRLRVGDAEISAAPCGKLRHAAERDPALAPAVGDRVLCSLEGDLALVREVLPRSSVFLRKAAGKRTACQVVAANVTTVFLVTCPGGDCNVRRLERYLVQSREAGAAPVVLINKADLLEAAGMADLLAEVGRLAIPVHPVSAHSGVGLAALDRYLGPDAIVALLGSSGVGKSTLANTLLGVDRLRTGDLRAGLRKGRHTTTDRRLLALPGGGFVLDTPGMRELGLWAEPEAVDDVFADIARLALRCRFRDCRHMAEPGCAVSGKVAADRLRSYRRLCAEAAGRRDRG